MKISSVSWLLVACLFLVSLIVITSAVLNLSNTSSVHEILQEFDENRSEKKREFNALKRQIGFGGMIHAFKNYLVRNEPKDKQTLTESFGGTVAIIKRYRLTSLSGYEEQALRDIENTVLRYKSAANIITKMLSEKKYSVEELDEAASVGDEEAIHAMVVLMNEDKDKLEKPLKNESKEKLLYEIIEILGYGGLIHQYKNYLIRREPIYLSRALADVTRVNGRVNKYLKYDLAEDEKHALAEIATTVNRYKVKLHEIKYLIRQGLTSREIDKKVRIDDSALLRGLDTLTTSIYLLNQRKARLLDNNLHQLIFVNKASSVLLLLFMSSIFIGAFWLLRLKIIRPINKLTRVMRDLSQGDYSIKVFGEGLNNEIGEMAESVSVLKKNSQQRDEFEARLTTINKELEQRVSERTNELNQKSETLRAVLDTAADAIITIDKKGVVLSYNAAAVSIFGYKPEQVIGQNIKMLMPEPYRSEHDEYLQRYANTGNRFAIGNRSEVRGIRENQQEFPMELAVSELQAAGEIIFTGIVRDLSVIKKAESELRKAKEEAEKANQVKSEFLSSMSHELRTPLNSILGFTQILEIDKDDLNPSHIELVQEIKDSGKHLLSLINEILDLVRIEAGSYQLSLHEVNITEVLEQSIEELTDAAVKKNISIVKPEIEYSVLADADRLKQVFKNLLSNAINYIDENGLVNIDYEIKSDAWLRISVVDNGRGLSEHELSHLFTPFERLDASCSEIEGAGIGLVTCKRLVKLMNGKMGVESEQGKGSTFWFELKQADNEETIMSGITAVEGDNMKNEKTEEPSSKCILYIEDNITNLKVVEKWFAKTTSYKLLSAINAKDGLALLEKSKPDLVLLDINLPGMGGYEALEIIRNNSDYADLPVIAVTANAMVDDIERGLEAGFNSYITKPIDLDELVRAINILLG